MRTQRRRETLRERIHRDDGWRTPMSRIDIPTPDGLMPAYYLRPRPSLPAKAPIVLLHEGFGLNEHIESIADRLANRGHAVVAPHLYYRSTRGSAGYDDVPLALKLSAGLTVDGIVSDFDAAARIVSARDRAVIALGFCFGGAVAYIASALSGRVDRGVAYYPVSILNYWDSVGAPKRDLLVFFGDRDAFLGAKEQAWLSELGASAGGRMHVRIYPGAGHAFFNDSRPALFAKEPARRSWALATAFLDGADAGTEAGDRNQILAEGDMNVLGGD